MKQGNSMPDSTFKLRAGRNGNHNVAGTQVPTEDSAPNADIHDMSARTPWYHPAVARHINLGDQQRRRYAQN